MMAQRRKGVFAGGGAMDVGSRPHSGFAHRGAVEREQALFAKFQVIDAGDFHEKVVGMLAINDGPAERRLALLKQFGVLLTGNGARFEAEHGSYRQLPRSEIALRHRHEPVGREHLVSSTWTALP